MAPDRNITDTEIARNCFSQLRWAIEQISDPVYQTRVWLGDVPDENSSYLDASAELLDQDERYELISQHLPDIGLDAQRWARVVEFSRALQEFEESVLHPYDSAEVLKHPNWNSIVEQARALLPDLPKLS